MFLKYVGTILSTGRGQDLTLFTSRFLNYTLDTRGPTEILYHFLSILEQATYQRASELQLPDCTAYFMKDLQRLAAPGYIPTQVKHTCLQMVFDFRSGHAK